MRTLTLLFSALALLLLAAPRVEAQCTDLGGGCSRARAECFGVPRVCCPFGFGGIGLDPQALATYLLVGDCLNSPFNLPQGSVCNANPTGTCFLLVDPRASFLVPLPVGPRGDAIIRGTVPCDPSIVGTGFCTQVLQIRGRAGRICLDLTNALDIRFQGRGICR